MSGNEFRRMNNTDSVPVSVFIKNAKGSELASKIVGYFTVRDQQFRFTAIAFGRIGGNNIGLKIAKKTLDKIKSMGIDPEILQLTIQRKLIEGDIIMPTDKKTVQ
jgi:hypothetical protein